MSKILLIGGTGAMGRYLVDELVRKGCLVVVTSRRAINGQGGVTYIQGNGHDEIFIERVLKEEKPDVVVDFMVYSSAEFKARHRLFLNHCAQYIYISSYRVFAESELLTESSPQLLDVCQDREFLASDDYALAKARGERLLRDSGRDNWTIVRPSITYSTNRFQFGCLEADIIALRALQGLPVVVPKGMLDKVTTMTWGGDVAKMLSCLILNKKALGEDFNVVTSEHRTWREVAEIYSKAIGLSVREIGLSAYCEVSSRYQTIYDRMFDRRMDNRKILGVTGLLASNMTALADGLDLELSRSNLPGFRVVNIPQMARIDLHCSTRFRFDSLSFRERLTYERVRYPWLGATFNLGRRK